MLSLHNCTSGAFIDYMKLINEVKSNLAAVQNIQPGVELHELLLQEFILNRLKSSHRSEWENKFLSSDTPGLNQLLDFLERKCQSLELSDVRKSNVVSQTPNTFKSKIK